MRIEHLIVPFVASDSESDVFARTVETVFHSNLKIQVRNVKIVAIEKRGSRELKLLLKVSPLIKREKDVDVIAN